MVLSEKDGVSYWLDEGYLNRLLCRLGGRCEFFLHKGTYSQGCITVDKNNAAASKQFDALMGLLEGDAPNTMTVKP